MEQQTDLPSPEDSAGKSAAWRGQRAKSQLHVETVSSVDGPKEEWRSVKGYEGFYEVSNMGPIRSLDRIVPSRPGFIAHRKGIMLLMTQHHGYCGVTLRKDGEAKQLAVARVVAQAFIPNPENMATVNHKNGIKTDNRVENLEWMSGKENTRHGRRVLGRCVGESNGRAVLTEGEVREIRELYSRGISLKQLKAKYSMSEYAIWAAATRRLWKSVI